MEQMTLINTMAEGQF